MEFSRHDYWSGLPFPSPLWRVQKKKKKLDDQMNYVERVYVPERHDRGRELEGPRFPQETWNVHTSATEQQPQDEQCSGRLA